MSYNNFIEKIDFLCSLGVRADLSHKELQIIICIIFDIMQQQELY